MIKNVKVLQLIDSLHTGGAERVAVNMANALSSQIEQSYLCATREEGLLKESISKEVNYLFLNKQKTIDFKALRTLRDLVKNEGINVIHAHSSSFFLATLVKIFNGRIKIVWHDHYGNSEFLEQRKFRILKLCSKYFSYVLSVNRSLESWAKMNLKAKAVMYLPNFAVKNDNEGITTLKGENGKRIICLANLRPQKDHFTLMDAFGEVVKQHPDWTLHCVGKDFDDEYSIKVRAKISMLNLKESAFLYGSLSDTTHILKQCSIGLLSSKSEGLPIALLEYGLSKLPVIATKVGECATVIKNGHNGLLVDAESSRALCKAMLTYIEDENLRKEQALRYGEHIEEHYSYKAQMQTILKIYKATIQQG